MNKTAIFKSALVSAMLVVMIVAFVPVVSANVVTASIQSNTYYGERAVAFVQGDLNGGYYTSNLWHAGRVLVSGQSRASNLYFTFYGNGLPMSSSTANDWYDGSYSGSLSSLGASSFAYFYDSRIGTFRWDSGTVSI